jgi:hypothetical protein
MFATLLQDIGAVLRNILAVLLQTLEDSSFSGLHVRAKLLHIACTGLPHRMITLAITAVVGTAG